MAQPAYGVFASFASSIKQPGALINWKKIFPQSHEAHKAPAVSAKTSFLIFSQKNPFVSLCLGGKNNLSGAGLLTCARALLDPHLKKYH